MAQRGNLPSMAMQRTTFSPRCCYRNGQIAFVWRAGLVAAAYRNLENELLATVVGVKSVQNGRKLLAVELDWREKFCVSDPRRQ